MEENPNRKQSRFLLDLDEYYKAREKHTYSFGGVPCPQNFIPGATKAKTNVKLLRSMSRKVSSVCYRGVVIQMKETMTAVEKGLIPAGLLALGVPTPSQHTSCLEHKLEQFWHRQSKLFDSLPRLGEDTSTEAGAISEEEDKYLLSVASTKPRGCSMPTTSRDVGSLPVLSYDDNFVAVLGKLDRTRRVRRMSFPLNCTEYERYEPRLYKFRSLQQKPVDSVARLSVLCRGASYHESVADRFHPRSERAGNVCDVTRERMTSRTVFRKNESSPPPQMTQESPPESPQFPWQKDALRTEDSLDEERDTRVQDHTSKQPHRSISLDASGTDVLEKPDKGFDTQKKKTLRERFTLRRKKTSKSEDAGEVAPDKETLSHIQRVLRSKLPKTLQTTVKMGLSFDPMTAKERNYQARECPNLTVLLGGRVRSRSTPGTPIAMTRKSRSQTVSEALPGQSLIGSPSPLDDINNGRDEKSGFLETFKKLTKNTLSRSDRTKKDQGQESPSLPRIEVTGSLGDSKSRKLENILGPEFRTAYTSNRSNSVPLIRRKKTIPTKKLPFYARSTSEIGKQEGNAEDLKAVDMWSSYETSDSELSYSGRSRGVSFESEANEQEKPNGWLGQDAKSKDHFEKEQKIVTTPEILVYLSPHQTNMGKTSGEITDKVRLNNRGHGSEANKSNQDFATRVTSHVVGSGDFGNESQNANCICGTDRIGDQKNDGAFVSKQETGSNTLSNGVRSKGDNEKTSLKIKTTYVLLKGPKHLKTSQELIAECKASHPDHHMSIKKTSKSESVRGKDHEKVNGNSKEAKLEANDVELQELEMLIKELESYAVE